VTLPLLELTNTVKNYGGLRPLRIERLAIVPSESVAIVGLDEPMAEVFVNLVTGGALPDVGEVRIFGRSSSTISDSTDWLSVVDRFGIVSHRAVLLEAFTLLQNVAVPFTLDLESIPADVESRVVKLAREVGLPDAALNSAVATLDAASQLRVRLARALALDPDVVLLEHPTAAVDRQQVGPLGEHIRAVARSRGAVVVALTGDAAFANAVATRVLTLDASTGRLTDRRGFFARLRHRSH
jgi:ABC-type transporter Mla maintaining outer membrane lipid asymmetry ATPase subunit MlaF